MNEISNFIKVLVLLAQPIILNNHCEVII